MKKIITTLTTIAMLICSFNIGFAYAEQENVNVDTGIRTIELGLNTSLEVYVTDGYSPIPDATVSVDNKTVVTDENGIAYVDNIRTSYEPYTMIVTSAEFGEIRNDVLVTKEDNNKRTVSYWTPECKSDISAIAYTDLDIQPDQWTDHFLGNMGANKKMYEYNGKLYIFSTDKTTSNFAIDLANNTCTVLSSIDDGIFAMDRDNGILYTYSAGTIDGPDLDSPERTVSYSINAYNLNSGDYSLIEMDFAGGRLYSDMAAANGKIYLVGGTYLGDSSAGMVNEIDYNYIDCYDVNSDNGFEYRIHKINGIEASAFASDGENESYRHVIIHDEDGRVYSINTANNSVVRLTNVNYKSDASSLCAYNDVLYVLDGDDKSDNFYVFDLNTGEKKKVTALPGFSKVYAAKGYKGNIYALWGNQFDTERYVGIYNIAANDWSAGGYNYGGFALNDFYNNSVAITNGILCVAQDNDDNLYLYKTPTSSDLVSSEPKSVGINEIKEVNSLREQTLALDEHGNVYAWGEGYYGLGSINMKISLSPKIIESLGSVKEIERGKNHNLILDKNGDVWGWGSNTNYPLGDSGDKVEYPTKLEELSYVEQIAAGAEFSLFLVDSGAVYGNWQKQC